MIGKRKQNCIKEMSDKILTEWILQSLVKCYTFLYPVANMIFNDYQEILNRIV